MIWRRKAVTFASLLILMIRIQGGSTIRCHPAEYLIGNECCPTCSPGSRVKTDCTEFRSTSCQPCSNGTYMNQPTGLKNCLSCTNCDPGSGLRTKRSCTLKSNTVCEPLEGFYCIDSKENSCVAAEKHTACKPGQYISSKGTASTDTVCSDCSHGTFSDGTFTSCQQHTQCEAESQLIKPGTSATDAECGENSHSYVVPLVIGLVVFFLILGFALLFLWKKGLCKCIQKKGRTPTKETTDGQETNMRLNTEVEETNWR
ncbi:tumor necrosis factor receptor superfamily member 14-like isoform X2 [Echeneis naucrates]|uniref:tumor necrosis factor receptor superfamily member 14-like isoform X2 n=1 Tax=Echeneis naucrates TaxID=173247 RepID=UPI001113D7AB|nr:tumor necrosis factor receptor superfamily member 14-like isoform X2 [Echeneis naucrates]